METVILYLIGACISWYLMFKFMCWFGIRSWPNLYYPESLCYKEDIAFTGILSIVWPIGVPILLLYSLLWSLSR